MNNDTFQIEIPDRYIGKNKNISPEIVVKSLLSTTVDWEGFEQHLISGQPYSFNIVDHHQGRRRADGFLSASHIGMDSDKNATLAEILNPANPLAKHIRYIAPSPSDFSSYRKLRVIFPLAQPVFDKSVLKSVQQLIYGEFLRFGVRFDAACLSPTVWFYAKETDEIANFDLSPHTVPAADYFGILRLPNCQPLYQTTLADYAGEIQHQHATPTIQVTDLSSFTSLLENELREAGVLHERRDNVNDKIFRVFKLTHCHTSTEHAAKDHGRGSYSNANITVWNDGGVTYKCFGGTCAFAGIHNFLRTFKIKNKTLKTVVETSSKRSNYTPQLLVPSCYPKSTVVDERYLSNAVSIQETTERLVILDSPLGTGKTKCLADYVDYCRDSGMTVLAVIPRRTLGTQASLRFDVVDYQGENRNDLTIIRSRTICVPSLNKLIHDGEIPEYDVLLIDEPSNVLKFFTEQGQGLFNPLSPSTHAQECIRVLIEIGRKAKKIVIAEACVDQRVAWVLRRMFNIPLDEVRVIKNEYEEKTQINMWSLTDEIQNSEIYRDVEEFFTEINRPWEAKNRFRNWLKFTMLSETVLASRCKNIPLVVACDEKEDGAYGIRRYLVDSHGIPIDEILVVTSDTRDSAEVHSFLSDPNGFIKSQKPSVIIHTAAMETGFSIEERCGVVVVADGRNHTLDASAILQMIGRCRNPAFVYCLLDERFRFENADPKELITGLITSHKYLESKHTLSNFRFTDCHAWVMEAHAQLTAESNRQRMRLIESVPALLQANGYELSWVSPQALVETYGCDLESLVGTDSLKTAKAVMNERLARQVAVIESEPISPDVFNQHRKQKTLDEDLTAGYRKGQLLELSGAEFLASDDSKIRDTLQLKPSEGLLEFVEKSSFSEDGKPTIVTTGWQIEAREIDSIEWARLRKTKGFIVSSEFMEARSDIPDEESLAELYVNNVVKRLKLHKPHNRRRFDAFRDFHAKPEELIDWDVAEVAGAIPMRAFRDARRQVAHFVYGLIQHIGSQTDTVWIREWESMRVVDAIGHLDLKKDDVRNIDRYIQAQFAKDSPVMGFTRGDLISSHFKSTSLCMERGDYLGACRAVLYDFFYRINTEYNQPASEEKLFSLLPSICHEYEIKRADGQTYVILGVTDCMETVKRSPWSCFDEEVESIGDLLKLLNSMAVDGNQIGLVWYITSDEEKIIGVPCRVYRGVAIDTNIESLLLALRDTATSETVAPPDDVQNLKKRIRLAAKEQEATSLREEKLRRVQAVVMSEPITVREITEQIELPFDDSNKKAITRKLNDLMKKGKIARTGSGKNTAYFGMEGAESTSEFKGDFPDLSAIQAAVTDHPQSISEIAFRLGRNLDKNATRLRLKRGLRALVDDDKVRTIGSGNQTRYFVGSFGTKQPFSNKEDLIKNGSSVPNDQSQAPSSSLPFLGQAVTTTPVETSLGLVLDKQTTHHGRKTCNLWYVVNDEMIASALGWLGDPDIVGLDFETYADLRIDDPLYVKEANPRLLSVSDGERTAIFDCACLDLLPKKLQGWLASKTVVCHNAQFDLAFLHRLDVKPKQVIDTMIMERVVLCAEGSNTRKTLSALCEKYLDEMLDKTFKVADWSPDIALSDEMIQYSALDAKVLIPLRDALHAKILSLGMDERAYQIFCDAIPAFVETKLVGMPIDCSKTQRLLSRLKADAARIERGLILDYGQYGYTTANSSKKIAVVIQRAFLVEVQSTSRETLTQLALDTNNDALKTFCEQVLSVRRLMKIATELAKYIKLAVNDRIHANYRLLGAISGRTTCNDPNLQQVSKGAAVEGLLEMGEIRSCFVAPPGYQFVVADYSQIELVLNAVHCGDDGMLSAFRNGADIHAHTASKIFGKPILKVSKEERQIGKTANFGLQYGMGTDGFRDYAKSYGIRLSSAEAGQIRRAWFESYPAIAIRHSQVKSQKPFRVRTIAGRLIQTKTVTNALNLPIQGSGASLLNRAIAIIYDRLSPFDASIVAYVHDELVVLVPEADAVAVASIVEDGMVEAGKDLYPEYHELIRSEVKIGQDWG